ncbi:hypothetical protein BDY19DRAFT_365760 [Irpex rosettiformis]|uniref:Uncharacterized protein n=1 Tax=Irpex rosettiformis TaxID=378272 RepID=A0ACB8TW28_9APHY|nr:hypothetical protein BDY19DRAFT_365760 [Irpex rosettiformis]
MSHGFNSSNNHSLPGSSAQPRGGGSSSSPNRTSTTNASAHLLAPPQANPQNAAYFPSSAPPNSNAHGRPSSMNPSAAHSVPNNRAPPALSSNPYLYRTATTAESSSAIQGPPTPSTMHSRHSSRGEPAMFALDTGSGSNSRRTSPREPNFPGYYLAPPPAFNGASAPAHASAPAFLGNRVPQTPPSITTTGGSPLGGQPQPQLQRLVPQQRIRGFGDGGRSSDEYVPPQVHHLRGGHAYRDGRGNQSGSSSSSRRG